MKSIIILSIFFYSSCTVVRTGTYVPVIPQLKYVTIEFSDESAVNDVLSSFSSSCQFQIVDINHADFGNGIVTMRVCIERCFQLSSVLGKVLRRPGVTIREDFE